jgi:hypothetical protein
MTRPPKPLPDLDDAALAERLRPLETVLPGRRSLSTPSPVAAPTKPPRQGMEFLLPVPVIRQLKAHAAERGVSATVLLLEILRDAGYPVTEADFLDLRRITRKSG